MGFAVWNFFLYSESNKLNYKHKIVCGKTEEKQKIFILTL